MDLKLRDSFSYCQLRFTEALKDQGELGPGKGESSLQYFPPQSELDLWGHFWTV